MAQDYEEIVRQWYNRLRPEFLRRLTAKYSGLSLYDAENLYQDTFIAVQENLILGRIKEDTSWSSYIMTIGMNMASKAWRKIGKTDSTDESFDNDDDDSSSKIARRVEELLKTLPDDEDETPLYKDPEAQSLLGNELIHTPEPCGSIIRLFYYEELSMDEIAEEIGYKNATTAKAKKSQCMTDLIKRVTDALNRAVLMSNLKNAIAMERIELFDNYINNRLSDTQRSEFDARLMSDEAFASDFRVYLMTVDGICREAHQDNIDFGMAMKHLSKEKLREIIGQRDIKSSEDSVIYKPIQRFRFKSWMWQVASIAAVIVIAFTAVYNIEKNARYSVDDAIYACADINTDLTRDGSEVLDIQSMTDNELKEKLPLLVANYNSAKSSDDIADNGFVLAMAYLRLHDRNNAKAVLNTLVHEFDNKPEYAGYVSKWQSILNVLK